MYSLFPRGGVPALCTRYSKKATTHAAVKTHAVPRMRPVIGRFTTEVENFHGRMAMVGIAMGTIFESTGLGRMPGQTIMQQFTTETGILTVPALAFVTVVTAAVIFETVNPATLRREEPELEVFTKPGFTPETEMLHGRLAMLGFAYALLSEQLYSTLVL